MDRNQELLTLLDAELEQYSIWAESEANVPGSEYWETVDALLEGFYEDAGTGPMAKAEARVDQLRVAYEAFNDSGAAIPGSAFWRLRGEVQTLCRQTPPRLAPLESVAELLRQKVSHLQIARIWRLLNPDGRERLDLVQAEIDKPSSVITAEHVAMVDNLRLAEAGWGPADQKAKPKVKPPEPAKFEGIEELIRQRVPVSQIVAIKSEQYRRGETKFAATIVLDLAAAMGVNLPGSAQETINAGAQQLNRDLTGVEPQLPNTTPALLPHEIASEVAEEEGDDEIPVEDKIIELHEAGHDVKTIAEHVNLPQKKIRSIIKNWEAGAEESEAEA